MKGAVVIIPTYNEVENIHEMLDAVRAAAPEARILVVDDNSPDGTYAEVSKRTANDPQIMLLHRAGKEGLGKAYVSAFKEVLRDDTVKKILMMDADFSHDPESIPSLFAAGEQADLVTGSRYVEGGTTEGWETWRKALSTYGNLYSRFITGLPMYDMTAGFNLIDADILRRIDLDAISLSGYAFQMELKYILWKAGARIKEIPITFRVRRKGESKISNHIIAEGLVAPWKMRFKKSR